MANKGDLLLEMKDVKKRFGGAIALRGTNLSVRAGEIHALLGENGAGKSNVFPAVVTLLSCIASNNADCVFGGVRFISSAKITLEKSGPFINLNCLDSSKISDPTISEGIKSGVN